MAKKVSKKVEEIKVVEPVVVEPKKEKAKFRWFRGQKVPV